MALKGSAAVRDVDRLSGAAIAGKVATRQSIMINAKRTRGMVFMAVSSERLKDQSEKSP